MKKQGAKRVSEDAKVTLKELLEEYAKLITEKAVKVARHAGRNTIRREDILLVKQNGDF